MNDTPLRGPGPTVYGPDPHHPGNWIADLDGTIASVTTDQLAAVPIATQWITYGNTGLIASWPTRQIAEAGRPCIGMIRPFTITADQLDQRVAILTDHDGQPLTGAD